MGKLLFRDVLDWYYSFPIEVFMGLVLIVTRVWTKLTGEDFYINKEGRKVLLDLENDLFFIKMKIWD